MSQSIDATLESYRELVGYVPDGIRARLTLLSELDPKFLGEIEAFRAGNLSSEALGPVVVQFLMFAILLFDRDEDALAHARIALRQGATPEQLLDVVRVAGWLGGAQAFNAGFRILAAAIEAERAGSDG